MALQRADAQAPGGPGNTAALLDGVSGMRRRRVLRRHSGPWTLRGVPEAAAGRRCRASEISRPPPARGPRRRGEGEAIRVVGRRESDAASEKPWTPRCVIGTGDFRDQAIK